MSVRALVGRLFAPGRPERASTWSRPKLEILEGRVVPARENYWVGPAGGFWSDPANWSSGHTPQPLDLLVFGGAFGANTDSVDDMSDVNVDNITLDVNYTSTLTVDYGGNTITSDGGFDQIAGSLVLHVGATLSASDGIILGGPTAVDPGVTISTPGSLYVNNSLTLAPDPVFQIGGKAVLNGAVYQAGTLNVVGGNELDINGFYNPIAGSLTTVFQAAISVSSSNQIGMEGELDLNSGIFATTNGLKVDGTLKTFGADMIVGDLENNGTIVWASTSGFTTLQVIGNYSTFLGTLDMRVATGGASDNLSVSGSANLGNAGTLNVTAQGPLVVGDTFGLITCASGSMTGDFNSFVLPPPPGSGWAHQIQPGDTYTLTASA
jgi:hypothetical protein